MCENEVVYTDVKFARRKEKADQSVSSSADTTYSEVKVVKTATEPPAGSRSKVTAERAALLVLTVLLIAAVAGLSVTLFNNKSTKKALENLRVKSEKEIKNLTETLSKMNHSSAVMPTCPKPTTVTPNQTCKHCEDGWMEEKGMCYFFSTNKSNWNESRKWCQNKSGDLVKIDSEDEQIFLGRKLTTKLDGPEDKFWIGLTDWEEEGRWLWVDGSTLNQSLTFWRDREPDNWKGNHGEQPDGEDCARMGEKSFRLNCWFDQRCRNPHKFICEKAATDGVNKSVCVQT